MSGYTLGVFITMAVSGRVPVTTEGEQQLRDELRRLEGEERFQISKRIAEARAHGDLSENAEYHAAREEQGLLEARVRYINTRLSNAQVIDVSSLTNEGKVIFGSTVTLGDQQNNQDVRYKIVGEDEADVKQYKLSITAPLTRALIGNFEGDEITVETESAQINYKIVKVEYLK